MSDDKDGIIRDDDNGNNMMTSMDVSGNNGEPLRKVHQCCGCCCDFRKAVLIVDGIFLGLAIVGTIYALAAEEHLVGFNKPGNAQDVDDFPDDEWSAFVADSALLKFGIANGFIVAVCYVISMMGALRFRWKWILPLVLWSAVGGLINFIMQFKFCQEWDDTEAGQAIDDEFYCYQPAVVHVLNWILYGVWLYPHLALIRQLQSQRVTRDNYPQQKSCCCKSCC